MLVYRSCVCWLTCTDNRTTSGPLNKGGHSLLSVCLHGLWTQSQLQIQTFQGHCPLFLLETCTFKVLPLVPFARWGSHLFKKGVSHSGAPSPPACQGLYPWRLQVCYVSKRGEFQQSLMDFWDPEEDDNSVAEISKSHRERLEEDAVWRGTGPKWCQNGQKHYWVYWGWSQVSGNYFLMRGTQCAVNQEVYLMSDSSMSLISTSLRPDQ